MEFSNPGKYTNVTGKLNWLHSKCDVKDATFEILEKERSAKGVPIDIIFHSGSITNGKITNAYFLHCNAYFIKVVNSYFCDGVLEECIFFNSVYCGGEWLNSRWHCGRDKFFYYYSYFPFKDGSLSIVNNHLVGNIAKDGGVYRNFTGHIYWHQNKVTVKDADFELCQPFDLINIFREPNCSIIFHNGSVVEGHFEQALIQNISCDIAGTSFLHSNIMQGNLFSVTVENSTIYNANCSGSQLDEVDVIDGNIEDNTFGDGTWYNGVFAGGSFISSDWHNGIWLSGSWDINSRWYGGSDGLGNHFGYNEHPNKWR